MNDRYKYFTLTIDDSIARVTLGRPEVANALNERLVDELREFFIDLYWRPEIRVIILDAQGRNFCAGLDMQERDGPAGEAIESALIAQRRISEIVLAMRRCPQPIVALVNGAASGGGFGIALAADVRIAAPDMRMNAAFIRIGLSACDIGVSYFLPRMVGTSIASEYMLTGRFIDAERAYGLGLVSTIVPHEHLLQAGIEMAQDMLRATPLGLRLTKDALNYAIDASGLEAAIAMEDRNQILCTQGNDFKEGIAAFREKRQPNFGQTK